MSHSDNTKFTPSEVDEQIERHLSGSHSVPNEQAAQQAVQRLQRIYQLKSAEYAPSLERVRQRVLASDTGENATPSTIAAAPATVAEPEETRQSGIMPLAGPHGQHKPRARRSRVLLAQLAAVLCLIVIVGSFILVTALSPRGQQSTLLNIADASGLYAYLNQSIYRLDSQTHTILWKHTFASGETVQEGTLFSSDMHQPFVVHGILYIETQENKANGRQYLYALNSANGSVLWRQPSARAFVNSTAVYTLMESRTIDVSTLTARDLRTGKQLWQRRYPIAGARIDPARGTDSTEGFRIVTLTDQLLYAVVWYRYNGQDIFTRYGLSPKDGSILWQDRSLISGRMPIAAAQIVNGVIYTTEYNLKPVNPSYVDSHGMTVSEMVQSRAAAYDAATGTRLWQTPEMIGEEPNGGFYLAVSGDLLYFQTYNQDWPAKARQPNSITTLHALSTLDGSQRWRYQSSGDGGITGAVLQGQSLYLETSQFKTTGSAQDIKVSIVALNAQTGDTRWTTPVKLLDGTEKTPTPAPGNTDFSSGFTIDMTPVASNDAVYYSTPGNRVYALEPSNGKILTQFWIDKTPQTTVQDRLTLFVVP